MIAKKIAIVICMALVSMTASLNAMENRTKDLTFAEELARFKKSERTNGAAMPRTTKLVPISAPETYEVLNGLSGLQRDIILRLIDILTYKPQQVRVLIGMCLEHAFWINHSYFISARSKIFSGVSSKICVITKRPCTIRKNGDMKIKNSKGLSKAVDRHLLKNAYLTANKYGPYRTMAMTAKYRAMAAVAVAWPSIRMSFPTVKMNFNPWLNYYKDDPLYDQAMATAIVAAVAIAPLAKELTKFAWRKIILEAYFEESCDVAGGKVYHKNGYVWTVIRDFVDDELISIKEKKRNQ